MSVLRAAVPSAALLNRVNPNRWSRAHFPGVRYNILSSNSVECMNAHSRFPRKGAIVGFTEYFRSFQQEWYSKRLDLAEVRVQRRAVKSASWTAHDIGYGEYEVQHEYRDAIVHYFNKTCTCKNWQLSGLPSGHAIGDAAMHNLTDCSQLAFLYFTVDNLKATVSISLFHHVVSESVFKDVVDVNNTDIVTTSAQKVYLDKDHPVADKVKQQRPKKWMMC
ncbi:hypothetical protein OSB04_011678 [Centaurea solstitialis]|uniref:Zinc finger PMZ-type domain-containing protein n=1 Tax=Centaurea solstitialis TaxID=347529 RepID=A0AA38TBM6_9ASTR|nr:hypothetical protein OSB04_011678 [Centaurea solstitialis]